MTGKTAKAGAHQRSAKKAGKSGNSGRSGRSGKNSAPKPTTPNRLPFLLLLLCAVLGGWSFWTAGIFDGEIADDLRTSSVYADPGFGLDVPAAERAIGNRRLAVAFLDTEDTDVARDVCGDLERAADGVLVMIVYRDGDELTEYGCSWLYGDDDDAIGKNYVAETQIANGTSGFVDRPLLIVKQMATNYDQLVRSDTVPQQARVIHPSAPRYLLAFIALGAVVVGVALLYLVGRRAGGRIENAAASAAAEHDDDVRLQARLAGIAAAILRLDDRYATLQQASVEPDRPVVGRKWRRRKRTEAVRQRAQGWIDEYRSVCAEYTDLTAAAARPDHDPDQGPDHDPVHHPDRGVGSAELFERAETLADRVDELESFGADPASSK